jgi:phospholipid/cholesterol/gamma-HCH transport system ATP-binding protein
MIEIHNLHKKFNNSPVLKGLSLNIDKGQTCVIIGRSGCGKSVLLKHIVGLLKPEQGKVMVDGKEVAALNELELDALRSKISMVFQGGALFDSMNVTENVGFSLIEHTHIGRQELLERVEEALGLVGLGGIGNLMPSDLSGGMKNAWLWPGNLHRRRSYFMTSRLRYRPHSCRQHQGLIRSCMIS